ncbi:uncharacterized protein B0T23DRAFT_328234, partial [Neurospora hispaniola]
GRGISITKEKVVFLSCYSNCVLHSAKFSLLDYQDRTHGSQSDQFFTFWPIINRYAAPYSLVALGGPIGYDF